MRSYTKPCVCIYIFFLWHCSPTRAMAYSFLKLLDHTQERITVGRTPLDAWSARRRDPYLTTHNTHNRQSSLSTLGLEPTISVGEQPQTYALDRAATGTGIFLFIYLIVYLFITQGLMMAQTTETFCLYENMQLVQTVNWLFTEHV